MQNSQAVHDLSSADDLEDQGGLRYLKLAAKYVFSHLGLFVLVCAYCVGGAFLFIEIEGADEETTLEKGMNRSKELEVERDILAEDLWMHKWSVDFNETVEKLLNEYHANVTEAIENYGYKGTRINSTAELEYGWSFSSALLFTVTIVTTIGYGHVSPDSEVGQLVVIFYSLLGIPLMLMFLANIGDAMANFFRVAYGKGCCYFCYKQRRKNYEVNKKRQQRIRAMKKERQDRPRSAWDDEKDFAEEGARRRKFGDRDGDHDELPVDDADDLVKKKGKEPDWDDSIEVIDDIEEEVINVPISLTLVIIAAYVFIGAVLFAAWNDWSWITGAYFSFVTLSTIGFGDLVPGWSEVGTTEGKVKLAVSSFYIILGLAVLSMSFNLMMEEMIAKFKWLGRKLGIVDDPPPAALQSIDDKAPLVNAEHLPDIAPAAASKSVY